MSRLLIVLAFALIPFGTSFHLNPKEDNSGNDTNKLLMSKENSSKNLSASLSQFNVVKRLGGGALSEAFLARKIGGLDDGQLYALKYISISHTTGSEKMFQRNCLTNEREILEAAREWPFATGLHYAWHDEHWMFVVMDFVSGGSVASKFETNRPDPATAQLVFAEAVSLVEKVHERGFVHADVNDKNLFIDSEGHLILGDFGLSYPLKHNNETSEDWTCLRTMCNVMFDKPIRNENEKSLKEFLYEMTDDELPELKNHPYFNGIDWNDVADRKMKSPFQPNEIKINEDNPIDVVNLLKSFIDINKEEVDQTVLGRLQNYAYIAPEHQH